MASTSDVKMALSEIANYIKDGQIEINKLKNRLQNAYNILDSIPTTYAVALVIWRHGNVHV